MIKRSQALHSLFTRGTALSDANGMLNHLNYDVISLSDVALIIFPTLLFIICSPRTRKCSFVIVRLHT